MSEVIRYMLFIGAVGLAVVASSCEDDQPILSSANRVIADSIVRMETKLLVEEMDSLCNLAYKVSFNRAVDSVSKVRLDEIDQYIPAQ